MKEKVLPFMVTTYEAFCLCLEENMQVIYICMELYTAYQEEIHQNLEKYGYEIPGTPTPRGVFYAKGVDLGQCTISDPYGLF